MPKFTREEAKEDLRMLLETADSLMLSRLLQATREFDLSMEFEEILSGVLSKRQAYDLKRIARDDRGLIPPRECHGENG